jgi:ferredoxin
MVKKYALECGASVVGIGDMERYEGAPRDFDPRYIFPEARAIIGFGFRIHRGLLRGVEEGTFFAAYPAMGYANINDVYAPMVLRKVGDLLEDNGYEAVLYQNTSVRLGSNAGRPVRPDYPRPDVFLHFRIAAFICGMGEIGYSKVFLTPRFGPRQRFAFIITDAPLEPDPLYEGPPLCDRCMRCVAECPGGAISGRETVKVTIAGREIEWGKLDEEKCSAVFQTSIPEYDPFMPEETAEYIREFVQLPPGEERERFVRERGGPWAVARQMPYNRAAWESYHHPGALCGARGCIRACMIHLEEQGKLENKFHNRFRLRPPWKLEV